MLRMSTLFVRTLRDDPADAEVPSHRLMVRGGYIRRAAPGGFTWLPLGWIVYRNVERIIREEMDREGFQEVHFPALLPREPYEASGRWYDYGDNLFRLQDRRGVDMLLAPDPRGDVHAARQGPVQLVQGPSPRPLPDPDEVPGRGPAARRPAAQPRVRDEGQLQLRHRRRRAGAQLPTAPGRLHPHVRAPRAAVRDRVGDVGGDGRIRQRGVPRSAARRRGHVRPLHELRLRGQHRGGRGRRAAGTARRWAAGGTRRRHPRHADDRDARRPDERPRRPAPRGPATGPRPTR